MIIDTNRNCVPHLDRLKTAGISTVIRYLSPINPHGEKSVHPDEARALAAAGIRLGLVTEGWGDFAHGGISAGAGERDGEYSFSVAASIGAQTDSCIYFAVDTDASHAQIRKLVIPYFESIARHKGGYRVGVYGSGAVCTAVLDAGLADCAWLSCSTGWTDSRAFLASDRWQLHQHVPATVAGIDADPDDSNGDFGDFLPFEADQTPGNTDMALAKPDTAQVLLPPPDSGEHDMRWVQDALNQLNDEGLDVDGIWGRETRAAILRFQRQNGRLNQDSIAGPQTIAALQAALKKTA